MAAKRSTLTTLPAARPTSVELATIRKAVCRARGGHENATDEQIMAIWSSLTGKVQQLYLEAITDPPATTET